MLGLGLTVTHRRIINMDNVSTDLLFTTDVVIHKIGFVWH